ncbi:MAG: DNA translocase FtsK [Verrucomicrobia bacterium]|jgi:DNA segregation ATPase FtsK/SpoIIIE, S-DNA-T family|nr:DNA translocase FtsK [Verrucomicrobiota bacterium]MBT7065472.1 DNA translocase FtsK [Verrucomicrobiota bacterium]MBT7700531.1 DNA translocase FtsK [Verrucomicrobiota bacterium]
MTAWTGEDAGWRRLWGIILVPLCLFLALGLFSYDWKDIGLLQAPPNSPPANLIGPVGAWLSFGLLMLFGVGAYLAPLWCFVFGVVLFFDREERVWPRGIWLFVWILSVVALIELNAGAARVASDASWVLDRCRALNITEAGGLFGRLLIRGLLVKALSPVGTGIVVWSVFAIALILMIEVRNLLKVGQLAYTGVMQLVAQGRETLEARNDRRTQLEREERQIEKRRRRLERVVNRRPKPDADEKAAARKPEAPAEKPKRKRKRPAKKPEDVAVAPVPVASPPPPAGDSDKPPYQLPPMSLLEEIPAQSGVEVDTDTTAMVLVGTLREFGIETELTNVDVGPVVTRYELLPAPGVRVERISGLSNNLALALKATSVRVQAPVPGKGVVGVEVPNAVANMVVLREILEGKTWRSGKANVPLCIGKDVAGVDIVGDLAAMPHLLIAGATGAGKTVCMNSILAGLLMSKSPEELRLLLVDPKIVEFSVYNDLPHLVVPVITDPHKVCLGLRWAINEMEKRYKLFAQVGVRNIASFNSREVATQEELFGGMGGGQTKGSIPQKLPYIVIVIDELADLMLAAQADIENSIARLAQLSRAVGIHMIIATQRPSVNVITGTIKANFPGRVAFQTAQKNDSRIILDAPGADKLLGRGDMLYLPPGSSKLVRAQGSMTTDDEIGRIVNFIKQQAPPAFVSEIKETIEKSSTPGVMDTGDEDDALLSQAVEIIRETRRASTSSLQRRLRIGYTRAARVMDILEERGLIGPPRGSEPREILIDLDGEIPENPTEDDPMIGPEDEEE